MKKLLFQENIEKVTLKNLSFSYLEVKQIY